MRLKPGKFYRDRSCQIWCCFQVDLTKNAHAQADCVRVSDGCVEYFFLDGRYDVKGLRENTLIEEVTDLSLMEISP